MTGPHKPRVSVVTLGVADLRQSGLRKVKAGITSLEEINRVTKD